MTKGKWGEILLTNKLIMPFMNVRNKFHSFSWQVIPLHGIPHILQVTMCQNPETRCSHSLYIISHSSFRILQYYGITCHPINVPQQNKCFEAKSCQNTRQINAKAARRNGNRRTSIGTEKGSTRNYETLHDPGSDTFLPLVRKLTFCIRLHIRSEFHTSD
jgi:hypothetical protein